MNNVFRTRKAAFAAAIERVEATGEQQFVQKVDGKYEVHGWIRYPGLGWYGPIRYVNVAAYRHWFSDPRHNVGA